MSAGENVNRLSTSRGVIVSLVVAIGIGLSAIVFFFARNIERQLATTDFERAASDRVAAIEREIDVQLEIVESIASLFAGFEDVTREKFGKFAAPQLMNHAGIQALEWIPRVPEWRRAEFEQAAREDGFPEFRIAEQAAQGQMERAGSRSEYFPVYYVEPYAGNEIALGFDLGSNPTRLAALEAAAETGQAVATGRITLVQETGRQFAFLIFHPIFSGGGSWQAAAAQRETLEGFSLGVFSNQRLR